MVAKAFAECKANTQAWQSILRQTRGPDKLDIQPGMKAAFFRISCPRAGSSAPSRPSKGADTSSAPVLVVSCQRRGNTCFIQHTGPHYLSSLECVGPAVGFETYPGRS